MPAQLSSFPFLRSLQISGVIKKYAKNLRRLFWCILAFTVSIAVYVVSYTLSLLEIVDDRSLFVVGPIFVAAASSLAYLWVKADCLEFDLELSFTHWLNIGCLLDVLAVLFRFGGRWVGIPQLGRTISVVLGTVGLLAFIWFLAELAKLTKAEKQVANAKLTFWSYAACGIFGLGVVVCRFFELEMPLLILGLALAMLAFLVFASIQFELLLWRLSSTLREFAEDILVEHDAVDDDHEPDETEHLETI